MGRNRYTPAQQAFYRNYLNSPRWALRRKQRIAKAGGQCEFVTLVSADGKLTDTRCVRRRYLQVHHNNYSRLGAEYDSDLAVYCWFHHQVEHLLWKVCATCPRPCLIDDEGAERWLAATLSTLRINLDNGPVNWMRLPNKERLLAQIGRLCSNCHTHLSKDGNDG